jgi:peroxiredoxin/cytochrome c553
MIRWLLIGRAVGFTSVAVAADPKTDSGIGIKAPAPTLSGLDGRPVAFDDVRGKTATVVVFVSFECPVSNSYAELLNDLAKTNAEKGVKVVLVCPTADAAKDVAKASAGFKLAMPVLLDSRKELAAGLKAKTTPEAFVLDGDGMVRYRGRIDDAYSARLKRNPIITSNDLADALAAVVAGKPVARAVTTPVGCTIDLEPAAAAKSGAATFHKDVAPILNNHCVVCHRQGEVGPFALTTYTQARRWAEDIKEYTRNRQMPPWMPTGGMAMRGERKLTDKEIATLAAWADAGTPEGDPKDAPPDYVQPTIPEPDMKVAMPGRKIAFCCEDCIKDFDKVLMPGRQGEPPITKRDIIAYYAQVAPFILPAVADRPLVMKRFPNGIDGMAFYQQRSRQEKPPPGVRIETLAPEIEPITRSPTLIPLASGPTATTSPAPSPPSVDPAPPEPRKAQQQAQYESTASALGDQALWMEVGDSIDELLPE